MQSYIALVPNYCARSDVLIFPDVLIRFTEMLHDNQRNTGHMFVLPNYFRRGYHTNIIGTSVISFLFFGMASGPVCLGCVAQDMTTTRKGIRVYACFIHYLIPLDGGFLAD
jgi:hypothetical protein